jgi:hypothetical protein
MSYVFAEEIEKVIDSKDEALRPRLHKCMPKLLSAVQAWGASRAGEFVMAAATPNNAWVLTAGGWPEAEKCNFEQDKLQVATALVEAIESKTFAGDMILGATAILIGAEMLAQQRADHERIARIPAVRWRSCWPSGKPTTTSPSW